MICWIMGYITCECSCAVLVIDRICSRNTETGLPGKSHSDTAVSMGYSAIRCIAAGISES